jgi:hypothetical protein
MVEEEAKQKTGFPCLLFIRYLLHTAFLCDLFFDDQNGGDTFLRNVG